MTVSGWPELARAELARAELALHCDLLAHWQGRAGQDRAGHGQGQMPTQQEPNPKSGTTQPDIHIVDTLFHKDFEGYFGALFLDECLSLPDRFGTFVKSPPLPPKTRGFWVGCRTI